MANRLHYTPYPSWARFTGSRTNFIRARTTSRHGPSTGEILVRHGWDKVVYKTISIRTEPIFFGTRNCFIQAVPKIFCSVNGPIVLVQSIKTGIPIQFIDSQQIQNVTSCSFLVYLYTDELFHSITGTIYLNCYAK